VIGKRSHGFGAFFAMVGMGSLVHRSVRIFHLIIGRPRRVRRLLSALWSAAHDSAGARYRRRSTKAPVFEFGCGRRYAVVDTGGGPRKLVAAGEALEVPRV